MNMSREEAKKCVGPGWSGLIDEIYDRLPDTAHISQIKEKFGGLRFYVYEVSCVILDFVDKVEERSLTICEDCGKPGRPRSGGWIRTLCDDHAKLKV